MTDLIIIGVVAGLSCVIAEVLLLAVLTYIRKYFVDKRIKQLEKLYSELFNASEDKPLAKVLHMHNVKPEDPGTKH